MAGGTGDPPDNRRHDRFPGSLTVQVTGDGTQRFGTIFQVSLGGAFLEVSPLPAVGAVVELRVLEGGTHQTLRAEVRYRAATDAGPRGLEGVGVSWRELTPDGRGLVERIVARAQVGRPLRGE
jgi:hypothetical protein